jgi:uncharacterized protein YndB with AHSA1/START domain
MIARFLMDNDFEPVVGHRFNFRAQPVMGWNGITDCEVLIVEPPTRLTYSWSASGEQAENGFKTTVTWTLTPGEGGTLVRMEQSGFRPEGSVDEGPYRAMSGGWPGIVEGLERVVQTAD